MKPFFSVIIPTLDEKKAIPVLIHQLKEQTYQNFEIIVVDGNSTDGTLRVLKRLQADIPQLKIFATSRRNLCYQKNYGATQALGTYLVFQDADNELDPAYLQRIREHITQHKSTFLTTYQLPDSEQTVDRLLSDIANVMLEIMALTPKQMAPGYNLIVKRDLFQNVQGFDEKVVFSEDHDLSIRLLESQQARLQIVRHHVLKWSFRRLRKDGRVPIIMKYAVTTLHMIVIGKITDEKFRYVMGGARYSEDTQAQAEQIIDSITSFFRKLSSIDTAAISHELHKIERYSKYVNPRSAVLRNMKDIYQNIKKFLRE